MTDRRNPAAGGRLLLTLAASASLCTLAACSDMPGTYPSLAKINPMGTTLSKEEQAQMLKDLRQGQQTPQQDPVKANEPPQ